MKIQEKRPLKNLQLTVTGKGVRCELSRIEGRAYRVADRDTGEQRSIKPVNHLQWLQLPRWKIPRQLKVQLIRYSLRLFDIFDFYSVYTFVVTAGIAIIGIALVFKGIALAKRALNKA